MKPASVMIVEDEGITALALEEGVKRLGYNVVANVTTGEEAIQAAFREHLDVILMDIHLQGGIDGITAARRIRRETNVPCIYMTAYSDDETLTRAKISEPYGYLVKPYNERELRAAIEIALHHNAMERERRAAQEALRAREKTLEDIIDNSPAIIYLKDTDARYTLVNRRFEAVFGVTKASVRGKENAEAVGAMFSTALGVEDQKVLREGASIQGEQDIPHGEWPHRYVALRFPLRQPDGTIYGACAVMTDITDLKRIEKTLRTTEDRYRLIAEGSGDVITLSTFEGEIQYVSPACRKLIGYEPEELVGQSGAELIHPDDLMRIRMTPPPRVNEPTDAVLHFRLRRKDGSSVPVEANIQAITTGAPDTPPIILSVTRDITERVRMETEIKQLNADLETRVADRTRELQSANKQLEAFTHSVSHDLRAPVRGITHLAEELEEGYAARLDTNGARIVEQIRKETVRLGVLMTELLDFSRASRADVNRRRTDLSGLAHTVIERLQRDNPGRAAQIVISDAVWADCDPILLQLVLENLLGNAWKFSSQQAIARIKFGRQTGIGGAPVFFVRDNGIGFDAAKAEGLFQPFHRFHTRSAIPGTGLGLSIVKAIIQRHGGRVWAESHPGQGATFYFTLARPTEGRSGRVLARRGRTKDRGPSSNSRYP